MAFTSIETSQNVPLDLSVASTTERVCSYLIDALILFVYYLIASKYFNFSEAFEDVQDDNLKAAQSLLNLLFFTAPFYFYDLIFEVFNKGKTPGKMLLKLQVIKINGEPAGFTEYWTRWLLRIVDFYGVTLLLVVFGPYFFSNTTLNGLTGISLMFTGLIAILFVSNNTKGQRVGDILAGTTVSRTRFNVKLSDTILLKTTKEYKPTYTNVLKLSDKDVRLIKETLVYYNKTNDAKYITILAQKAQVFLDVQPTKNPVKFLQTLMKDYNHLAVEEDGRN